MLCHLNETVQPIHLKYFSFMVQNHPLLQPCRSRPTSVLVQGACRLAGLHKSYPTVRTAQKCSCVWCTFVPLQTPFCPFLMLLIWRRSMKTSICLWVCIRTCPWHTQWHPTPQVTSGEELVSISWQKWFFHHFMFWHTLPLTSVSWRLVSIGKTSRLTAVSVPFLASPCHLCKEPQSHSFFALQIFHLCWLVKSVSLHFHDIQMNAQQSYEIVFPPPKLHRFWKNCAAFSVGFAIPGFLTFHGKTKQNSASLRWGMPGVGRLKVLPFTLLSLDLSPYTRTMADEGGVHLCLLPCLEFNQLKILDFPFWREVPIGRGGGKHSTA